MKFTKKIMALVAFSAILLTPLSHLNAAEEYVVDNGGVGYDSSVRSTSLAPAIGLGVILVVAIVAVAVQNTSGHAHCHSHCH